MKKASERKIRLPAWLCLLVVGLGLGENRAWRFFAPAEDALEAAGVDYVEAASHPNLFFKYNQIFARYEYKF